jgi:hypothetical protein
MALVVLSFLYLQNQFFGSDLSSDPIVPKSKFRLVTLSIRAIIDFLEFSFSQRCSGDFSNRSVHNLFIHRGGLLRRTQAEPYEPHFLRRENDF